MDLVVGIDVLDNILHAVHHSRDQRIFVGRVESSAVIKERPRVCLILRGTASCMAYDAILITCDDMVVPVYRVLKGLWYEEKINVLGRKL